jgi:hypothetical protein
VVLSIQDIFSSCRLPEIVSVTVKKTVILCRGLYGANAWSVTSSEEQTGHVRGNVLGAEEDI